MSGPAARVVLELEDGTHWVGTGFGAPTSATGEVVFATGMVGYPESLTDPSYRGQILVTTYPLIGNYGVPRPAERDERLESGRIQAAALVVAHLRDDFRDRDPERSLHHWLASEGVPALEGVDTRALTLRLRERGTMLGRVYPEGADTDALPFADPNTRNLVAEVSLAEPRLYGAGGRRRVVLVDCGVKSSIRRQLVARGLEVLQVPWDYDYSAEDCDGIFLSNGPGDPAQAEATSRVLRRAMALDRPIFGICLGTQIMARAAGARTYKLRYGHRGQNQPCREVGTERCALSSQNHGFAIDAETLPDDWEVWFQNANDGSVEGIRQ